jgi:hypothetical protein
MYKVFLCDNKLILFDKTDKDFREKYGKNFEQVTIIKDYRNIDAVLDKLSRQYRLEAVKDTTKRPWWGWYNLDEEGQREVNRKRAESLKNYVKTEEHRANLSKTAKKYRHFKGKKHSEEFKARLSQQRMGISSPTKGMKWMYNPDTGIETLSHELKEGHFWGRNPEFRDNDRGRRKY